jgi:hypothetical protein
MKVAPLLSSKLSVVSHSSHSSPPPTKYAWCVLYPMQAVPEKVEKKNFTKIDVNCENCENYENYETKNERKTNYNK